MPFELSFSLVELLLAKFDETGCDVDPDDVVVSIDVDIFVVFFLSLRYLRLFCFTCNQTSANTSK